MKEEDEEEEEDSEKFAFPFFYILFSPWRYKIILTKVWTHLPPVNPGLQRQRPSIGEQPLAWGPQSHVFWQFNPYLPAGHWKCLFILYSNLLNKL